MGRTFETYYGEEKEECTFDFNDAEMVKARLNELLAMDIPKMTVEKLREIVSESDRKYTLDKMTPDEIEAANEYFSRFCEYGYNEGADIFTNCKQLRFQYGLRHGEMDEVTGKGLPRRYYHYIKCGGTERRFEFDLQYHPTDWEIDE